MSVEKPSIRAYKINQLSGKRTPIDILDFTLDINKGNCSFTFQKYMYICKIEIDTVDVINILKKIGVVFHD